MRNLTDIKYRIKGVSETRQITGAMETISVAKHRRAVKRYEANEQFFLKIRSTIKDIITHTKDVTHRYLSVRPGSRAVFVVIASDKGLAGSYNHNVLNYAWDMLQKYSERYIFTIGQVAREFFERKKAVVDVEFAHAAHEPVVTDAMEIVDNIISLYDQNMMDEVYIVYTEPQNTSTTTPKSIRLLPLTAEKVISGIEAEEYKDEQYYKELYYEPSAEEVLNELVPQYLVGVVYGALVQASAAEHSSRMLAMSNATRNAGEILDKLHLEYNRARQESITSELLEIITASYGVNV